MHSSIVQKYYDKLIPGLKYEKLQQKNKFFTEFKVIGGLRLFKYFCNQELSEGDGFGDIEFFNNQRRNDGIVCITDCVLASMSKIQFNQMNKKIQQLKVRKLTELLHKSVYQIIDDLTILSKIAQFYEKMKLTKGAKVYKQGDPNIQYCYFVKKGELAVTKDNKQTCIIGLYKHFGEEEIIFRQQKRNFGVEVSSIKATVYQISKENFLKVVNDIQPNLLEAFKIHCQVNVQFRKQQINQTENTILLMKNKKYQKNKYIAKQIHQINQDLNKSNSNSNNSDDVYQILQRSINRYQFEQNQPNNDFRKNVKVSQTSDTLKQKLHKQNIQAEQSDYSKINNKVQLDPQIRKVIEQNQFKEQKKMMGNNSIDQNSIIHYFQDKSQIRIRDAFIKKQKQNKQSFKSKSLQKYSQRLDDNMRQLSQRQICQDSNGNSYKQDMTDRHPHSKVNSLIHFEALAQKNIQEQKEQFKDIQKNIILPRIEIRNKLKQIKNNPIKKQNYDLFQQESLKIFYS